MVLISTCNATTATDFNQRNDSAIAVLVKLFFLVNAKNNETIALKQYFA